MSARDFLARLWTLVASVTATFTSIPSRALTVRFAPSTFSIVPRTRTGGAAGGFCASAGSAKSMATAAATADFRSIPPSPFLGEVRIFPQAQPDGGRQFAWDLGSDSVMTNATVGTVTEAPQGKVVHVKFKDGESEYSIGPDVPILAPVPGDKSLLKPGAAVFLAGPKGEDGSVTASFMYVEKDGIKPPM